MMYDFQRVYAMFGTGGVSGEGSGVDHTSQLTRIETALNRVQKRVINRHKINLTTKQEEFYDDDQTTIIQKNDLKNLDGAEITSVDEIVESVPDEITDQ